MFDKFCCACCSADKLLYEVFCFRGHFFRRFPNGKLGKADAEDIRVSRQFMSRKG